MPQMITIKQAAANTGLSYNCLRLMCINGKIAHIRAGKKILINKDRLEEYLNTTIGDDVE
jgi:excisionase family DNA binding protein